jgi:hypothetical protein
MAFGVAVILGLIFGGAGALLSLIRASYDNVITAAAGIFFADLIIITFISWLFIFFHRPAMITPGLIALIFIDACVALVIAVVADVASAAVSAASVVSLIAVLVILGFWANGYNSAGDAHKAAYGIVHVTEEANDKLPASSTSNMVVVSPDMASARASSVMSYGVAATRNYASELDLGPATLQMVDGRMWYVFPLQFQGALNKSRLHAIEPGYIMVSAEDPGANIIERYDDQYSMIVSLNNGQGGDPVRWARDHGYAGYVLDDPTLEIQDGTGDPYYTVTLLRPQEGWTFPAPADVLLINAHTGQVTRYNLPGRGLPSPVPGWVDRVYSSSEASQIAGWYGFYAHAPYGGQGNTSRYQVSGDPVMVYTGNGHPSWRMLLTSYSADTSVYRIIEMNAATGAMQVYTPAQPMGTEDTVDNSFANGQGAGAGLIRANHLQPAGLTLHVIYGHLTWMVSYEPDNASSFSGIGFLDAYHANSASNVAFGATKAQALQNYLQQLASEQTANGNAPGAGGTYVTVTGTIASIRTPVSGGNTTFYITMNGANGKPDYFRVYTGTSALGAAVAEADPGDHVIMQVLKVTQNDAQQTIQSFSDAQHPLAPAGA